MACTLVVDITTTSPRVQSVFGNNFRIWNFLLERAKFYFLSVYDLLGTLYSLYKKRNEITRKNNLPNTMSHMLHVFVWCIAGEKLVQWASENLVVEVLIHCQVNTLQQCMKNLLSSFTKHRHIIHAGYTFEGSGSWILQVSYYFSYSLQS